MTHPSLWDMEARGRGLALEAASRLLAGPCGLGPCRVLDVGCGSGRLLETLVARLPGLDAVGVDPYGEKGVRDGIRCERLGAEALADLLERFDLLVTLMSLHHFASAEAFFRAAHFAVRWPAGRLLVVDWKEGVETGIPERYFSMGAVEDRLRATGWVLERAEEHEWHFLLLARPARLRIAVAVSDGETVGPGMFGTAPRFALYDWDGACVRFAEVRRNPYERTRQHAKTLDVARFVQDASLLVASRIGPRGQERLAARGIRMLLTGRTVPLREVWSVLAGDGTPSLPQGWVYR